ncbi:Serine/threonine-protein kinase rio1 [Metarhizium acridum]|nr:Serine/threonine-protein kinase rio1 [Metarhizium acridum]
MNECRHHMRGKFLAGSISSMSKFLDKIKVAASIITTTAQSRQESLFLFPPPPLCFATNSPLRAKTMPEAITSTASAAAPHEPPFTYTANNGYVEPSQAVPPEVRMPRGAPHPEEYNEDDDNDFDDIFEDDDLDEEEWSGDARDLTKNYNRQRQLQDNTNGAAAAAPRSNQQKPTANTFASVDDQVSALSKHAAKIRLDSVKQSDEKDKDKADRATSDQVLDQRTRMILLQMINRGFVSEVHGAISTGKEANVYGAMLVDDKSGDVIHRAIKVYKTAILVFKDRERYITGEHRFKGWF